MEKKLAILRNDPWLEPYAGAIEGRHHDVVRKLEELTANTDGSLKKFANAYNYFGLHREKSGKWTFREYAPNATKIYIIGTMNDWSDKAEYELKPIGNGNWEVKLPADALHHGDLYKLHMYWNGGEGERLPAYARRVVHFYSQE